MEIVQRCVARIAATFMTIAISACVTGSGNLEALESSANPVLKVKWSPPCALNSGVEFFGLEIYADGLVRYRGGDQTRVIGEQTAMLQIQRVRRIARVAESAVTRSKDPGREIRRADENGSNYCLEVEVHGKSGSPVGARLDSFARESTSLVKLLDEVVDGTWVCPARQYRKGRSDSLQASNYCGDPWDDRPAILYVMVDETGCLHYQVDVYKDVVHFAAARRPDPGDVFWTATEDRFLQIETKEFRDLISGARELQLEKVDTTHRDPTFPPDYEAEGSEDVMRFRDVLRRVIGLEWEVMPAGTPFCTPQGNAENPGGLVLRFDAERLGRSLR